MFWQCLKTGALEMGCWTCTALYLGSDSKFWPHSLQWVKCQHWLQRANIQGVAVEVNPIIRLQTSRFNEKQLYFPDHHNTCSIPDWSLFSKQLLCLMHWISITKWIPFQFLLSLGMDFVFILKDLSSWKLAAT